ncbi:MAG TPA: DUF2007 domain-containing protein [Mycobacteriales bacterium]|nr:DUF2007 domain-containing protein [Mycobacteriales bacterium]
MSNHARRRYAGHVEEFDSDTGFWHRLRKMVRSAPGPVAVGFAGSTVEAELMVGYLRSQGIHAVSSSDDAGGVEPALQTSSGVRVLVPHRQHAEARRALEERK